MTVLFYTAQLSISGDTVLDYLGGPRGITKALKSRPFPGCWQNVEQERLQIQRGRRDWMHVCWLEDGVHNMHRKECGQPEGAEGPMANNQQENTDCSPTTTRKRISQQIK